MNEEEHKKRLAILIADAIQHLLRDSDELASILEDAYEEGYDVFLSIFSGIMVRRREMYSEEPEIANEKPLPRKFEFTDFDKEFLKSIGIQVSEE